MQGLGRSLAVDGRYHARHLFTCQAEGQSAQSQCQFIFRLVGQGDKVMAGVVGVQMDALSLGFKAQGHFIKGGIIHTHRQQRAARYMVGAALTGNAAVASGRCRFILDGCLSLLVLG